MAVALCVVFRRVALRWADPPSKESYEIASELIPYRNTPEDLMCESRRY